MGDAIVADVKLTLAALLEAAPESDAPGAGAEPAARRKSRRATRSAPRPCTPRSARSSPTTAIVVLESPSSTLALRNQLRISRPGSYYFGAGGGLGFGLAAAVGVQLAQPDRPVVCVLGEGSAQYAITAFWTRRRLRRAGHLPRPAQRGVRDPQVVRRDRAGHGRARPRPAGARRRRGRRGLRRHGAPGSTTATESAAALQRRRSPPRSPSWSRSPSRPACRSSRRTGRCRCSSPTSRTITPEPSEPATDRAPDCARRPARRSRCAPSWSAARRRPRARPGQRPDPLRLRRQPVPAAPAGGGHGPRRRGRRQGSSPTAASSGIPVTFRSGGTSLNGQGQTDGILVDVRRHFGGVEVEDDGAARRGSAGHRCSATSTGCSPRTAASSAPTRPRPTSPRSAASSPTTRAACAAASTHDSYSTVRVADLRAAVGDGDRHRRARRRRAVRRGRARAGRRAGRDPRRDPRRRRAERADPAQVRDQEHDRLPALRVPRRRRAGRDLPPAARRLRGHARLHRRGGLRDGAAARPHHDRLAALPRHRRPRPSRSPTWSRPARPRSS